MANGAACEGVRKDPGTEHSQGLSPELEGASWKTRILRSAPPASKPMWELLHPGAENSDLC